MTEKKVEDMFVIDGAEGFEDSEAFDEVQEVPGQRILSWRSSGFLIAGSYMWFTERQSPDIR